MVWLVNQFSFVKLRTVRSSQNPKGHVIEPTTAAALVSVSMKKCSNLKTKEYKETNH